MKGTVFGAVVRFPTHPEANMHGEVRCIIRARLFTEVIDALAMYGVDVFPRDNGRNWCESQSVAEQRATTTAYGEVLACAVARAYLSHEHYKLVPTALIIPKYRKEAHPNGTPRP